MSINEIQAEREAQKARWGDAKDDGWSLAEWGALLSHYATRQAIGDLHAIDLGKFRADMVKVGALALAAIEAVDRKTTP